MTPTYRIKDWDRHFENAKSRTIDSCSFVCVPNKQHGGGFTRIMAEPDGAAIFGVWVLLIEAASRQPRPRSGWLTEDGTREGSPWASDDLALRWRRTEQEISRALAFLSSSKIGWIEIEFISSTGENGTIQSESLGPIPDVPEVSAQYPPSSQITEGTEQKGIERKERTEGTDLARKKQRATRKPKFLIPEDFKPSESTESWAAKNTPSVNLKAAAEEFVDYWLGEGGLKSDWQATFKNRLRFLQDRADQRNGNGNRNGSNYQNHSTQRSTGSVYEFKSKSVIR